MIPSVKLNNGIKMPVLGLGTWQSANGKECESAVLWALEAGYRHIDTAAIYGNEQSVGNAIKKSRIARKEIFLTTKLWNSNHGSPEKALAESLKKLQTDYADLYLIHWPVPQRNNSWKILESLYKEGKCRAIGVSNFTIRHLNELLPMCKVIPAVNQVEFSPFNYQQELLDFCAKKKIQLEAYSPLSQANKLDDLRLSSIAMKCKKSPAQIMLRWAIEHNLVAIPKSVTKSRIKENFNIFDFSLTKADMKILDGLNEGFRVCPNPETMP